jgi:cell division protein FtsL
MTQIAICVVLVLVIISIVGLAAIAYAHEQKINSLMSGKSTKKGSAEQYYNLVKHYYPQADALYAETIIDIIGRQGFHTLKEANLIEEYNGKFYFM